jgi:hypothetical protein
MKVEGVVPDAVVCEKRTTEKRIEDRPLHLGG